MGIALDCVLSVDCMRNPMSAEAKKTDSIGRALYAGRCKSSDTTTKEAGNHSNQELTRTSYKYDWEKVNYLIR